MRLRFVAPAAGLLMISFSLVAAQPPGEDPAGLLASAFAAHQKGDYALAVEGYRAFIAEVPDVADVYSNLGAAYVQLGRLGEAISAYEKALELRNATNPAATRFNLALAYYKSAQLSEAVEELRAVLEQDPGNLQAALILADCYMLREEYKSIVDLLSPFEPQNPENRALVYLLGTALIRTDEVARGQVLVDRILRQGDSAEAHLMLGTAHMAVRDVDGALQEFERAIQLNPLLPGANAYMAKTLREMGRVDEAFVYSERELEINPNDFESHLYVGVYRYKREQRYEDALKHFQKCLEIRPGAVEARFQVATVYILQGRSEEALEMVEQVIAEAPDFLEAHVTLTSLYYRMRRREDAERHREIVERLRAEKDRNTVKEASPDTNEPLRPPGGDP